MELRVRRRRPKLNEAFLPVVLDPYYRARRGSKLLKGQRRRIGGVRPDLRR